MRLWMNEQEQHTHEPLGTAVLDYLRDQLGLLGTKSGCREGDCGACTVLVGARTPQGVEYEPVCACLTPLVALENRHLVTVEGLSHGDLGPVQQSILSEGAVQCGFCTPGIVLSLTGYLLCATSLTERQAIASVAGNLCRCTGYESIRRAARALVSSLPALEERGPKRFAQLAALGAWPRSFLSIADDLPLVANRQPPARPPARGTLVLGGGTDLMVQRPSAVRGSRIVLASSLAHSCVQKRGDDLAIGSASTVAQLERSALLLEEVPRLSHIVSLIASPQIRSRATVAGNLVNASPIGDLAILLLALCSKVCIESPKGVREVDLERFFLSYKKVDLRPGELIVEVLVPRRGPRRLLSFEKVCKRTHLDIASVNSACAVELDSDRIVNARLSAGGIAPVPKLLEATSQALVGSDLHSIDIAALTKTAQAEISPIDDVRGSAVYKRLLLGRLLLAHIESFQKQQRFSGGHS
ncbi:MAG: FAD binding domain-containing protein [Myxococcota bacterium]|jgi:xanthine dehydrogenase small subunit|nr:FAD binding domain-containing protein [Myxococcota bacterium]